MIIVTSFWGSRYKHWLDYGVSALSVMFATPLVIAESSDLLASFRPYRVSIETYAV